MNRYSKNNILPLIRTKIILRDTIIKYNLIIGNKYVFIKDNENKTIFYLAEIDNEYSFILKSNVLSISKILHSIPKYNFRSVLVESTILLYENIEYNVLKFKLLK